MAAFLKQVSGGCPNLALDEGNFQVAIGACAFNLPHAAPDLDIYPEPIAVYDFTNGDKRFTLAIG